MNCTESVWPEISVISGGVSFLTSFIAQIPQLIETYNDKSVEGLSLTFLLAWLFGDIATLSGAILTRQLTFQILLAIYFLGNDLCICGQYYYYGILYRNKLATSGHEPIIRERTSLFKQQPSTSRLKHRLWAVFFTYIGRSHSMPLTANEIHPINKHSMDIGSILSWTGAICYVCARIPQLIKNYQRKSTEGISPFLFFCTLISNITYTASIFTSCEYLTSNNRQLFVEKALPFIIGSAGTIIFDLIYFYQHFVLYKFDIHSKLLEPENKPLLAHLTANI